MTKEGSLSNGNEYFYMKIYVERFSWVLVYIEFIACLLSVNNVCSLKFSECLESCHGCVYLQMYACPTCKSYHQQ